MEGPARAARELRNGVSALGLSVGAAVFIVAGWLLTAPYRAERSEAAALRDQAIASLIVQKYNLRFAQPYLRRARREFGQAIATGPWEAQFLADRAGLSRQEATEFSARPASASPGDVASHLRAAQGDYERALSLQPKRVDFLQAYAEVLTGPPPVGPERRRAGQTGCRRSAPCTPSRSQQYPSGTGPEGGGGERCRSRTFTIGLKP